MVTEQQVTQQEKCEAFASLHAGPDAFVIPNPWDVGSARVLQALGFPALATTSAGFAQTLGRGDGAVTLDEKIAHCNAIANATTVPVNVDFEDGYAKNLNDLASNILRVAATGVAGCSIEDFDRDAKQLFDFNAAVERVQAAVEAVSSLDVAFQLTARAENLLRGVDDLDDTILRLQAFEKAGAHVLYAPGLRTLDDVAHVAREVSRPLNVLGVFFPGTTVSELASAGARRISVGNAFASLSMGPVINAGRELLDAGTFTWMSGMPRDLGKLMGG